MIQRYLYTALTDGIAEIQNDLTLIDDIFVEQYGLSTSEVENIKTLFETKPPTVHHGYPHKTKDPPFFTIILGQEGEIEKVIGDDVGMVLDEDDSNYGADLYGSFWKHMYHVLIYTDHPDVTLYYYEIAKSIMIGALPYFNNQHLMEMELSGNDMAPDPRYIPEHLYARQLTFSCQREFQWLDKNSKLFKAFRVSGIHIDNNEDISDLGSVKTNITTYTTE